MGRYGCGKVASGLEKATLRGHLSWVFSVLFSPDGTTLASGSADGTVRLWEVASGLEKGTLRGQTSWVHSVSFSPDGTALASGNGDGTILLWDMAPYITHTRLNLPEGALARLGKGRIGSGDRAVTYSPDGTRLAVADETGIWLYDAHTGDKVALLTGHTDGVYSVSFSSDGTILASGSDDGTVRLWEVASGQETATLRGSDRVFSVSFSPDGTTLASGSDDGTVRLWEVATGQENSHLEGAYVACPFGIVFAGWDDLGQWQCGPDDPVVGGGQPPRKGYPERTYGWGLFGIVFAGWDDLGQW